MSFECSYNKPTVNQNLRFHSDLGDPPAEPVPYIILPKGVLYPHYLDLDLNDQMTGASFDNGF